MIEICGLGKTWDDGTRVLDDIDLSIDDGEVYAIVGRSGAGKSTLLRCINGLTGYQEGSLKVDGREVGDLSEGQLRELRREMGMVFQHFSLLERATVFENVALPMKCWGYKKPQIEEKVAALLELVGLADRADARPRNLSGGQKQRVAIARALTMDPKFILSDEATSALDPKTTGSILDLFMEINRKMGITIVFVTHQMEVVRAVCQRACVLEDGRIASAGTVEDIFIERPEALDRLLGEHEKDLPGTGHNVQIAYRIGSVADGQLLAAMSKELDYLLPVLDGQILEYRGERMGIFVVNIDDAYFEAACRYLDERGANWKELGRGDGGDGGSVDGAAGSNSLGDATGGSGAGGATDAGEGE